MKICPACGKKNKNRMDICACGFNFSGTGYIPGGKRTRAPLKEKKCGRIINIVVVCLAAIIVLMAAIFLIRGLKTMKWHEAFDPVLGISEGNIMLYDLKRPTAEPLKITKIDGSEEVCRQYQKVYISKDRKKLVFSNSFEFYDDFFSVNCNICTYDLETLPYFPKTAVRKVVDWTVSEDLDIFTYEKFSEGKVGLYQEKDGKEELVTDKYRVYSVSADGKELIHSNKNKKLKTEVITGNRNKRSFSLSEIPTADKGKITFSLNGNSVQATLPEGLNRTESVLTVTEKGSVVLCDEKSGKSFLYISNRFFPFSDEGVYFLFPDYPSGVQNIVKYDFSVLN